MPKEEFKRENVVVQNMVLRKQRAGPHKNRDLDLKKGSSRKQKHKIKPTNDRGLYYFLASVRRDD